MKLFKIGIYIFAAIALSTGASDFLQGLASQATFGTTISAEGLTDPIVDNVFRFFAALWFGLGILFLLFIRDLDRYKPAMIALLCIVILGGLGRILSIYELGLPSAASGIALVSAGLLAEVIVTPVMLWWLIMRHRSKPADL